MQNWRKQTIYFGEMIFSCAMAVVLLAASSHLHAKYRVALFAGGFVAWTLAEYAVHRFVLHNLAPKEHGLHHAHPDEAVTRIFCRYGSALALLVCSPAVRFYRES